MVDLPQEAVIVDRGYRHFEGTRKGRRGAMSAVVRDGLRRVLGLRRKGRRKILPWTLITMMLISVAVLSGLHYAANRVGVTDLVADELPHAREYFEFISRVALLFVAFATPELLVPDREQGVLAVYLSRPLRTVDYLAAKGISLGILILGFLLIPQTIFHLLLGVFSPDGFTTYMVDNLDVLWQVPAASLVYFLGFASVALIAATLIPRVGFAAGIFLGVMIMFNGLAEFFVEFAGFAGAKYGSLLGLRKPPPPGPRLDFRRSDQRLPGYQGRTGTLGRSRRHPRHVGAGRGRRLESIPEVVVTTTGTAAPTVTLQGVSRWFGQKVAVSEISAEFGPGVTGLLGPNGAGKTTLAEGAHRPHPCVRRYRVRARRRSPIRPRGVQPDRVGSRRRERLQLPLSHRVRRL